MSGDIVNSVGLVFDIAGAVVIWRFGLPRKEISRSGAQHFIREETDEREVAQAKVYDRLANAGIASLILGFFLQAVSNFV